MYIVYRKAGRGKREKVAEAFQEASAAREWVSFEIERREALYWRKWGLCVVDTAETAGAITATYRPAIMLYNPVAEVYTIAEAREARR